MAGLSMRLFGVHASGSLFLTGTTAGLLALLNLVVEIRSHAAKSCDDAVPFPTLMCRAF